MTKPVAASVRQVGNVSVVCLSGKISIGEGEVVLRESVDDLLEARHNRILVNLEDVPSMDSAGLGELVACLKRTEAARGALELLNPTESVASLLSQTKLGDSFEIFDDEETALATF
jgi:anti-sigma B factor antagonist